MSTICYDGKIIASDRQGTLNDTIITVTKLHKCGDIVYGIVGSIEQGLAMMEWHIEGAEKENFPKDEHETYTTLIVATKSEVGYYQRLPFFQKVYDKVMAWGSGTDFALGAMRKGATAIEAVEIAIELDIYSGIGIDHYEI